jgi:hypothetical protein
MWSVDRKLSFLVTINHSVAVVQTGYYSMINYLMSKLIFQNWPAKQVTLNVVYSVGNILKCTCLIVGVYTIRLLFATLRLLMMDAGIDCRVSSQTLYIYDGGCYQLSYMAGHS